MKRASGGEALETRPRGPSEDNDDDDDDRIEEEDEERKEEVVEEEGETCFFVEAETNSHCLRRATAARALRSIYHLLITIIPLAPLPFQPPPCRSILPFSPFLVQLFLVMSFTVRLE